MLRFGGKGAGHESGRHGKRPHGAGLKLTHRFRSVIEGQLNLPAQEIGDGSVRRLGPGDILIAEDLSGQGHATREVGPDARVAVFVPLQ